MKTFWFILVIISIAYAKPQEKISKPSYISYKLTKDSILVIAKNKLYCPTFITLNGNLSDSIINLN